MAAPRKGTVDALMMVIRYLKMYPSIRQEWFANAAMEDMIIQVYADSDWASDQITRKSTSGGVFRLGPVVLAHWSKSQAAVALSSAEA